MDTRTPVSTSRAFGSSIIAGVPDLDTAVLSRLHLVLTALLAANPQCSDIAWIGGRAPMLEACVGLLRSLQFRGRILTCQWAVALLQGAGGPEVTPVDGNALSRADLVILDFGRVMDAGCPHAVCADGRRARAAEALIERDFEALVRSESKGEPSGRQFVCIDPPPSVEDSLVMDATGPSGTSAPGRDRRVVYGAVRRTPGSDAPEVPSADPGLVLTGNLIGAMSVGESGQRVASGVVAVVGRRGVVLHGPHRPFPPGRYRADVRIRAHTPFTLGAFLRPVILEVAAGSERLATESATFFLRGTLSATFRVSHLAGRENVYLRLLRGRWVDFTVTSVRVTRLAESDA